MVLTRKSRKIGWIGGILAVIVLAAAKISTLGSAQAGDMPAWSIAAIEGTVSIRNSPEGEILAEVGAVITPGSRIRTGEDGHLELVRDGDSMTVMPDSQLIVPVAAQRGKSGIVQNLGSILFRMESMDSRNFEVRTPYLAAAVKGTVFTVTTGSRGARVAVDEGSVLLTALRSGQRAMLYAGNGASISDQSDAFSFDTVDNTSGDNSPSSDREPTGDGAQSGNMDDD